jgi:glucose/arabinose dehydrogenase
MKHLSILAVLVSMLLVSACAAPVNPPARQTVSTPVATAAAPTVVPPTATSVSTIDSSSAVPPQPAATPLLQAGDAFTPALEPLVSGGLVRPDYLTHAGDDRLFVIEQPGRIRLIEKGQLRDQPFLDITDKVSTDGNERGLLSVAFHPDYVNNGQFFVDYTRQPDGATVIERYTVSKDDPDRANDQSGKVILTIAQPEANHNGGLIKFGPDGYLYIGMGDGGGQGDQHGSIGNGQNRNALLGKLLRIDVTQQDTYAVPPTNPFRTEVWAYGLRNPWRFSFDRSTGDLYIADVGQNLYEEVDVQPAASTGGENYGWRIMEGWHCYDPQEGCDQAGLVLPVAEYSHDAGGCAITGGYVYRGSQYPALQGAYFFGDYCSGIIWSLQREGDRWQMIKRLTADMRISSFGEDVNGELYVIDHGGGVYRLTAK